MTDTTTEPQAASNTEPDDGTTVVVQYGEMSFTTIWREDDAAPSGSPDERWFHDEIDVGMSWEAWLRDADRFWVLDEADAEDVTR